MSLTKAYAQIKKNDPARKANDYYPTAPVATYSLLEMEDQLPLGFPRKVWEPAAGRGWMSKALIDQGIDVKSSDLFAYEDPLIPVETGVDFLKALDTGEYNAIVTNPPYKNKLADQFMGKCLMLEDCNYFALLVRLTFMESDSRLRTFKTRPPTRIYPFSGRFNCDDDYLAAGKQFGGMVAYAWFVWDFREGLTDTTSIKWIDTKEMYRKMTSQ